MDELRRAIATLVDAPPLSPPSLEDLDRRNRRRHTRRRAAVATVIALGVVVGTLIANAHRPSNERPVITTPAASGGRLAVASKRGFTIIDESRGVIAQVDLGGFAKALDWSPNGEWLVASGPGDLWLADRDGRHLQKVPLEVDEFAWAPRGATLRISASDGSYEVQPGDAPRRVTWVPGVISPDGRRVAWVVGARLEVRDVDGSNTQEVSELDPNGEARILGWSPDSSTLLYFGLAAKSESFAQDGATVTAVRLDPIPSRWLIGDVVTGQPWLTWSPDGSSFVVAVGGGRFLTDAKALRRCDVAAMRCVDLPQPAGTSSFQPAWSPDGERLAFLRLSTSARESDLQRLPRQLWISRPDGSGSHRASASAIGALRPMWTADSDAIVELVGSQLADGVVAVDSVPIDGGEPFRVATLQIPVELLVNGYAGYLTPPLAWSPGVRLAR